MAAYTPTPPAIFDEDLAGPYDGLPGGVADAGAAGTEVTVAWNDANGYFGANPASFVDLLADLNTSKLVVFSQVAAFTTWAELWASVTADGRSELLFNGGTAAGDRSIAIVLERATNTAYLELPEGAAPTAPSNPAYDAVRIFARDNGAGKTQLCAIFRTGAIQVIATEP